LFQPEDPLAPPKPFFDEPWQAQALALADSMVQAGHFTASEWADALGSELRKADERGAPDTLETYFTGVLIALEHLMETRAGISAETKAQRRSDWEKAYLNTPHGKPVVL
jgi:nitrile hydratase accessory protein